jgi:hypothetical protein
MHVDLYHYEKRIMKPEIFSLEFSSPKEPGKKSVISIEIKSSVLQCKMDDPVVSELLSLPTEHEKFASESGKNSSMELPTNADEKKIEDDADGVQGLSLMFQEVQCGGIIANANGQCNNIFQSECKIKDKVCKLIIDGGSFTNAISSDLVHSLSLSMRRLPTPCYIQWMNQSGTLKITHKARVKFSIGKYVDSVDCDVAPVSACHLLLGRPWQFDVDATHGGCSNNYPFVHKVLPYVLKLMKASAIRFQSFPILSKKKHVPMLNPKMRMALFQRKENDMGISNPATARSISNDAITTTIDSSEIVSVNSISNIGKQEDIHCGECRIAKRKDRLKAMMNLFKGGEHNMMTISALTTVA